MLRFIVRNTNIFDASVGGPVAITYRTFDLINTGLEDYLREDCGQWEKREVTGVELRYDPADVAASPSEDK